METLVINKEEFPFEVSARGRLNLEGSKVDFNKVSVSELEALRFAYELCKGACKHFETAFKYDFNAFVDKVEPSVFEKARALAKTLLAPELNEKKEGKTKPEKKQ